MKRTIQSAAALLLLATLHAPLSIVLAQGTAFTYQGRFNDSGSRANGNYDLTFAVFTDSGGVNQIGSTVTNMAVPINNGLFTVTLDFGPGIFNGTSLWLQIGAETNGGGGVFTLLTPLQQLAPTPYAIYAPSAGSAFSATMASSSGSAGFATTAATANGVAAGSVTGAGIASSSVVKSLNSLQDSVTLSPGANITITPSGNTLTIASSGGGGGGGANWSLMGNAGTTPGTDFLGTTDDQALELHVKGVRGLVLAPDDNGYNAPNVIGGSPVNNVAAGGSGATIGGGGSGGGVEDFGSQYPNSVGEDFGTVGGGWANYAVGGSSTVGGGYGNDANAPGSVIGGGGTDGMNYFGNHIQNLADAATIGGGLDNSIQQYGNYSFIGGGYRNTINGGYVATIGGGYQNSASGSYATVPGGSNNVAAGACSFAAGASASANDNNSFLWSDGTRAAVSQGADTFTVLATGGAYFYTTTSGVNIDMDSSGDLDFGTSTRQMLNLFNVPGAANNYGIGIQTATMYFRCGNDVSGTGFAWYRGGTPNNSQTNSGGGQTLMTLTTGGLTVNGALVSLSDRNLKEHFQPVDAQRVLAQVSALPITRWNYKEDTTSQHIGPMAQDFYAAFGVGPDDKHITTIDEGGIALAAIQGLNQKLNEKDAEIQNLEKKLDDLQTLVKQLAEKK